MTVAEYIFDFLQNKGVQTVYMVSGSSAMWLTDALCRNEQMKAICCHHEQAAAMAADGHGRIHNIPGVCLVTIGPGATNAITGVAQAYLDSSPMFVISGQASSKLLEYKRNAEVRQYGTQSLDLEPIVSSITKYFTTVMKPEDIQYHMEKAYYEAMNGRKGPVWIDVPVDIQNSQIPIQCRMFETPQDKTADISDDIIEQVANEIQQAKCPLILAGYGVRSGQCLQEFEKLIKHTNIPVVLSRGGIDVLASDSPNYVGRPGCYGDRPSHFAIQKSDLLLILGSRLSVSTRGYYPKKFAENAKKIMVDIDERELQKDDVPIDIRIHADLKYFLQKLESAVRNKKLQTSPNWLKYCVDKKKKYPTVLQGYEKETPLNAYYFTKCLSEYVTDKVNVIVDTGSVCNIVSQSWKLKKGQRYLISGGLSCMGFWATSIGACQPERNIIALTGDGSAQMNIQELATLKYNKIPIKLFIYDNNGYMLIRHNQHNYMHDRFLGVGPDSGLQTPNFCNVAASYGIKNFLIEKKEDMIEVFSKVLNYDGPVVCQVTLQEFEPIEPRIASKVMPDGSLKAADFDDLYPFLEGEKDDFKSEDENFI